MFEHEYYTDIATPHLCSVLVTADLLQTAVKVFEQLWDRNYSAQLICDTTLKSLF